MNVINFASFYAICAKKFMMVKGFHQTMKKDIARYDLVCLHFAFHFSY